MALAAHPVLEQQQWKTHRAVVGLVPTVRARESPLAMSVMPLVGRADTEGFSNDAVWIPLELKVPERR